MEPLVEKSRRLTGYLRWLVEHEIGEEVEIVTPADTGRNGSQLSLKILSKRATGREVFQGIEAAGVSCDWREPNVIRAAPVPLYNRFSEVWRFVEIMKGTLG
jgi:kynureninase